MRDATRVRQNRQEIGREGGKSVMRIGVCGSSCEEIGKRNFVYERWEAEEKKQEKRAKSTALTHAGDEPDEKA